MTPREHVEAARQRSREETAEFERKQRELHEMVGRLQRHFEATCRPHLRRATAADYTRWLRGYLERGGRITHAYDYPLPSDVYVAVRGFDLPPLHGALSVRIIVPEGVAVTYSDPGHNTLYLMDGFDVVGSVPVYSDTDP